jgi:hypothetical protein
VPHPFLKQQPYKRGTIKSLKRKKHIKMAKLADIQESLNSDIKKEPEIKDFVPETPKSNVHDSLPPAGRTIFKLANSKKNGRVWLDNVADVWCEKTKKIRRARILVGVDSIWMDEQKDVDKDYAAKHRPLIRFEDRVMAIDNRDVNLIKFMRLRDGFIENANRRTGAKVEYYEWNPRRQEQEALEKEMLEIEVMQLAMSQPFEKLKKHAAFLGGISFNDELGEPRTEQGIRTLYVREAKRNPKRFKETIDSKQVEISYLVKRAIIDAKIEFSGKNIRWASGGSITQLPSGREATEFLIELAMMPNQEGKEFLERLQQVTK